MANSDVIELISFASLSESDVRLLREANCIEAKKAKDKLPDSLWDTYSAFANSDGGLILLGVSENSRRELNVTGVTDAEKLKRDFWNTVNDRSKVNATVLSDQDVVIRHGSSGDFIVIHVPRAGREIMPIYVGADPFSREQHRGTFRRNNEGDYHCDRDEVKAMFRDGSDTPQDLRIVEDLGSAALDSGTIASYRSYFQRIRPNHPWRNLNDEDFLVRLQALARSTKDNQLHPTIAGLLMFGREYDIVREFANYFLDYREEIGLDRWDDRITSTDGIWSGNLYDFWQSVYGRLRQAVPRPFRLDGEARRMDENPMEITIREALTNAIVHADYMGRRGTVIIRRQSTIEFTNPGRLRVTKAEAEQGGISDARNPILMKMFFLIGIGEKAGSGFDVMRAGCDSVGAPHPLLEVLTRPDRVKLVVRYTNLGGSVMTPANNESMKSWTSVGHLSKSESEALQYLVSQGSISTSELAEHMELGVSRARALLKSLVEDGFAQSRGRGRATRYEPVEGLPLF